MVQKISKRSGEHKEYLAELLKERIYATLALLAILIGIDSDHTTPKHAALIISGTIVSLWVASIVSTLMARRVIYQGSIDHSRDREAQIRKHAPMLATLAFPLIMLSFAMLELIKLSTAINISLAGSLLLLVVWSIHASRTLKVKKVPAFLLVVAELSIGLAVVALKLALGH